MVLESHQIGAYALAFVNRYAFDYQTGRVSGDDVQGDRVVVTILPDDSLQLDGEPLARPELVARVAARVAEAGEDKPAVIVSGDRSASLGTGVSLLADLKAAGVGRVSFQVSGTAEP